MKLAESRMDLSEISDEYISDEEEVNDTVKNRSESVATIVKSVKEGKSIETKKVNESLNKQLVETLQRQMDEESLVLANQEGVLGQKVEKSAVRVQRTVHKKVRNSDSDTEGEIDSSLKKPVRRQRLRKRQIVDRSGLTQGNPTSRLNEREQRKEAEMIAECMRMKKLADEDRVELKRQIKEAEKLKKKEAKVARKEDSNDDVLCIDTDGEE